MGQSGHFPQWCLELAMHFPSHYHRSVALSRGLWALKFYQLSLWKLLINSGLGCSQRFCKSGVPPSLCKKTCLRGSSDEGKAKGSSKLGSLKEETKGHLPISKGFDCQVQSRCQNTSLTGNIEGLFCVLLIQSILVKFIFLVLGKITPTIIPFPYSIILRNPKKHFLLYREEIPYDPKKARPPPFHHLSLTLKECFLKFFHLRSCLSLVCSPYSSAGTLRGHWSI